VSGSIRPTQPLEHFSLPSGGQPRCLLAFAFILVNREIEFEQRRRIPAGGRARIVSSAKSTTSCIASSRTIIRIRKLDHGTWTTLLPI
jgi:hypothetical protein